MVDPGEGPRGWGWPRRAVKHFFETAPSSPLSVGLDPPLDMHFLKPLKAIKMACLTKMLKKCWQLLASHQVCETDLTRMTTKIEFS